MNDLKKQYLRRKALEKKGDLPSKDFTVALKS